MKKTIGSLMVLTLLVNGSEFVVHEQGQSVKQHTKKSLGKRPKTLNFEFVEVRENNETKNILVPVEDVNQSGITQRFAIDNKLNSKDGLLIKFSDNSIEISLFEKQFSVTLKEKLRIGYYVFMNNSSLSDMALMQKILASSEGKNIETIKPNWKMQMGKF